MMVDKYDVKRDDIAEDINEDKTTSSKPVVINVPSTTLTLPTISMPSADSRAARIVQGSIVHTIKGFGKGAIIGMIVGAPMAAFEAHRMGIRGPMLTQLVKQAARRGALSWGLWLGVFDGAQFAMANIRRKNDIFNMTFGGFAAGAASSYGSGPKGMLRNGVLSAVILTAINMISF